MAAIYATAPTSNTADQNHSTPALRPHPRETGLDDDELAANIDLHHRIPIIFFDILDVPDPLPDTGIGDQDGYSLVLGGNLWNL